MLPLAGNHRVLVVSTSFSLKSDEPWRMLTENGVELVRKMGPFSDEELGKLIPGFHGVIVGVDDVGEKTLARADRLIAIAKNGVGVDNIDIAAATRKGCIVTRTPDANFVTVAEFTLALILSVTKNLVTAANSAKAGTWAGKDFMGIELAGKTLGLLGLGKIGKHVARVARAFQMRVIYYDVVRQEDFEREHGLEFAPLGRLLREADIVDIHVPLIKETHHLVGREQLRMMKRTAYLVNTSRGPVVDEEALYRALKDGTIAGAATDVYTKEPPGKDCPLFKLDNCLATPHMAGYSAEANERTGITLAQDMLRIFRGERPENALNYEEVSGKR